MVTREGFVTTPLPRLSGLTPDTGTEPGEARRSRQPGGGSGGDAGACPAPCSSAGVWGSCVPDLPQPRLAPPALVYSLQLRAEPGHGTVLHSPFPTFTDFAATLQPRSASHLPLLLGSNSLKTPLHPKVLFTTTVWRLWLTVPGEGGSGVPSKLEGREAHARTEERLRCLKAMLAGQSIHG